MTNNNGKYVSFFIIHSHKRTHAPLQCTSEIPVTETITETEIIDPTLTETETETMGFVETDIM